MPISVGLQHAGSFQVSGWPYLNTVVLTPSEQEIKFSFVSSEITVWNAGGADLSFYFTAGSSNIFILPAGKRITVRVKAGSIFALSADGSTIKLFVSMTNIPLARIGVIPAGSYFRSMPDADGDGIPDGLDMFTTYAGEPVTTNPNPIGDSELWMEYDDGEGGVLIYDKNTGNTLLPNTLYLPDCQTTFEHTDIQPIMDNLNAYYLDGEGVQQPFTITYPDLATSGVQILTRNSDQEVAITVARSTIGDDTVSVTVYFNVHFICIAESAPTTGYNWEGDFTSETLSYPSTPESTSMDPDDLGAGFFEET